jgi:hypothetical protein
LRCTHPDHGVASILVAACMLLDASIRVGALDNTAVAPLAA